MIVSASMRPMRTLATSWAAAILTTVTVMTIALAPTGAAPNCLTQPNFKSAEGRHWYYRTDPVTKRKCWFVKGRNESFGQAAAKEPPAAQAAAKEPSPAKPVPSPSREKPVQAIWDQLFPENPLYEPPARFTDTDRPLDTVQAQVRDRNADDQTGGIDRREPPPIAAAYTADELPAESAAERQTIALIAGAVLLIALAAGAAVKRWRAGRVSHDRSSDYLVVLSRATAEVDPDDRETRRGIYACAQRVLVDRLRMADPPVGETLIAAEQAALEAAIAQIELQSTQPSMRAPARVREPAERSFTPRFGSGGTRPYTRRRLDRITDWALGASRSA